MPPHWYNKLTVAQQERYQEIQDDIKDDNQRELQATYHKLIGRKAKGVWQSELKEMIIYIMLVRERVDFQ